MITYLDSSRILDMNFGANVSKNDETAHSYDDNIKIKDKSDISICMYCGNKIFEFDRGCPSCGGPIR